MICALKVLIIISTIGAIYHFIIDGIIKPSLEAFYPHSNKGGMNSFTDEMSKVEPASEIKDYSCQKP